MFPKSLFLFLITAAIATFILVLLFLPNGGIIGLKNMCIFLFLKYI